MHEILTMEEINEKFDGEWVLIEDVETDEQSNIIRGKVTYHGKDRDALDDTLEKSTTNHFASLYIGKPDPKMEFLLNF
ncbi:MAG: hypothetical protein H7Z37_03840 [Pyrinomonadaceae bacterium]|nr:hypothetical protein [Pyrinomonadaceae bacterium]